MFYLALIFFKLIGFFFSFIPRAAFLFMGRCLGALLRLCGFRKKVAEENLKHAFPDWSKEAIQLFLISFYQNLGILFLELICSFYRFDRFLQRAQVVGGENLKNALAQGKGVFVMTAHLGNWEVLTISGPQLFHTKVTMVTKELKPKWFHRLVSVTRSLLGVKMACEPKTMQGILRALKNKEIVGFVMDQYTGAPVGARVPFFGKPVGSHTALAALAKRTGVPVVPAISYRDKSGNYVIRFEPSLPLLNDPDTDTAILMNTANYVKHTEGWIREFPEQWLWIHRRWKGDLSPLPPKSFGEMLRS